MTRTFLSYGEGIMVMPGPAHIAQTVTVGLIVVAPVLVQVTRHVLLSVIGRLVAMTSCLYDDWPPPEMT